MENLLAMSGAREIPSTAFCKLERAAGIPPAGYLTGVAAGVPPAVEPCILPCGFSRGLFPRFLIASLLLLGLTAARSAETNKVTHASLKISGFGPLGNRELKKTIRLMSGKKTPPEFYEANFVEDAALIIVSTLNREGYLAPHITAALTLSDGQEQRFEWDKDIDTVLPGPLAVKKVRFRVRRGVRCFYRHLSIQGLKSLSQSEAQAFFVESGFLVS